MRERTKTRQCPYQWHSITSTRFSALANCFNLSTFLQHFLFSTSAKGDYRRRGVKTKDADLFVEGMMKFQ